MLSINGINLRLSSVRNVRVVFYYSLYRKEKYKENQTACGHPNLNRLSDDSIFRAKTCTK